MQGPGEGRTEDEQVAGAGDGDPGALGEQDDTGDGSRGRCEEGARGASRRTAASASGVKIMVRLMISPALVAEVWTTP